MGGVTPSYQVGPKIFAFVDDEAIGVKVRSRPGGCGRVSSTGSPGMRWSWPTSAVRVEHLAVSGSIPLEDLIDAIDTSYRAVVSRLPRSQRPATG